MAEIKEQFQNFISTTNSYTTRLTEKLSETKHICGPLPISEEYEYERLITTHEEHIGPQYDFEKLLQDDISFDVVPSVKTAAKGRFTQMDDEQCCNKPPNTPQALGKDKFTQMEKASNKNVSVNASSAKENFTQMHPDQMMNVDSVISAKDKFTHMDNRAISDKMVNVNSTCTKDNFTQMDADTDADASSKAKKVDETSSTQMPAKDKFTHMDRSEQVAHKTTSVHLIKPCAKSCTINKSTQVDAKLTGDKVGTDAGIQYCSEDVGVSQVDKWTTPNQIVLSKELKVYENVVSCVCEPVDDNSTPKLIIQTMPPISIQSKNLVVQKALDLEIKPSQDKSNTRPTNITYEEYVFNDPTGSVDNDKTIVVDKSDEPGVNQEKIDDFHANARRKSSVGADSMYYGTEELEFKVEDSISRESFKLLLDDSLKLPSNIDAKARYSSNDKYSNYSEDISILEIVEDGRPYRDVFEPPLLILNSEETAEPRLPSVTTLLNDSSFTPQETAMGSQQTNLENFREKFKNYCDFMNVDEREDDTQSKVEQVQMLSSAIKGKIYKSSMESGLRLLSTSGKSVSATKSVSPTKLSENFDFPKPAMDATNNYKSPRTEEVAQSKSVSNLDFWNQTNELPVDKAIQCSMSNNNKIYIRPSITFSTYEEEIPANFPYEIEPKPTTCPAEQTSKSIQTSSSASLALMFNENLIEKIKNLQLLPPVAGKETAETSTQPCQIDSYKTCQRKSYPGKMKNSCLDGSNKFCWPSKNQLNQNARRCGSNRKRHCSPPRTACVKSPLAISIDTEIGDNSYGSPSEGEINCSCSKSIGEIHACKCGDSIKSRVQYLKQHSDEFMQYEYADPAISVLRKRAVNDNWYTYYVASHSSSS